MSSKELKIDTEENIKNLIEEIINIHRANTPKIILDELLNHYSHKLLIDIIKGKSDKESDDNDFMVIGVSVCIYIYLKNFSVKRAIKQVSDDTFATDAVKGIKENTVKRHYEKFRKYIKDDLSKRESFMYDIEDVDTVIREFIETYIAHEEPFELNEKLKIRGYYRSFYYKHIHPF